MIIAFSGVREAGKTSCRNFVFGNLMVQAGIVQEYHITSEGGLVLPQALEDGNVRLNEVAINTPEFIDNEWVRSVVYPHVRHFSFAYELRRFARDYLNISEELLFGGPATKKEFTQYTWEEMPFYSKKIPFYKEKAGPMTLRDVLEYAGNTFLSHINEGVWANKCMTAIKAGEELYGTKVSILDDLRKKVEFDAVKAVGGRVIRLSRDLYNDPLASEETLTKDKFDWGQFDFVVPDGLDMGDTFQVVADKLMEWGILENVLEPAKDSANV